jgi:hypothetical protein
MGVGAVPARDGLIGWTRPVRVRDQEEPPAEPEGGRLLCRLIEGRDGNFHAIDDRGRRFGVKRARDGSLEIRHLESEGSADEADPDVTGTGPALGGDPAAATGRTGDALADWHRTNGSEHHMGALAELQRKIDEHYGAR